MCLIPYEVRTERICHRVIGSEGNLTLLRIISCLLE